MKRYAVVFILFLLSMITYIDRVCISTAKDAVARDLQLSDSAMGLVFGSFALGYALAQIPSGIFADRFGPRIALSVVVALWSALTALTGAAWNLTSLVVIRFLFGIGEAGAFPGSARAIYNWLPVKERGRANGIMFSGARVGAAIAFPLLVWMLGNWDWRMSFVILGGVGLIWAVFWFFWFSDHPEVPVVQPADVAGEQITIRDVFRSRKMALAMTQYFAGNFTFFLCLSWMLPYLKRQYDLTDTQAASYAMAPLLFGATAQWVAGFVVDALYKSKHRSWSRRLPAIAGFVLAAVGLVVAAYMDTPLAAVAWFTAATFGVEMTISPSWAFCADIAGKNSGSVSASMNMMGNVGSFISANAFPWLYGFTGTAVAYFSVAAALNVIAAICWFYMRSLEAPERAPAIEYLRKASS